MVKSCSMSLEPFSKNIFTFRYLGIISFARPALLIKDLELYKQIFIKDFDHFVDHQNIHLSDKLDPLFVNNLIFLRGK